MTTLIDLVDERAGYSSRPVLSGLDLRIDEGERIALVGESGAGKTTLLRLIQARCGARASLIPQDLGLVRALTVFHNIYMGRLHRHSTMHNLRALLLPPRRDVDAVRTVAERLRIDDKLFSPVGALSGGQQQRTAIGRALFHDGDVLIADEPVAAVDEHQARDLLTLAVAEKQTIILALHDRALALDFATRIVGLRNGRIVMDEPAATLRSGDLDPLYRT